MSNHGDEARITLDLARRRAETWYRRWREASAEVERLERAAGIRVCTSGVIRAGAAGSVRVAEDDGELDEGVSLEGIFGPPPESPR